MSLQNKKYKPVVLAIILGGGKGSRLRTLTKDRAKPAVPFLKYRLIDFPLSNCAISEIDFVYVIVQYEPSSLIEHCDPHYWGYNGMGLKIFGPNQTRLSDAKNMAGTSAAVRDNRQKIDDVNPDVILILSGDHIYYEDYTPVIEKHVAEAADLTVYTKVVPLNQLKDFGAMKINAKGEITKFVEKPQDLKTINLFKLSAAAKRKFGIESEEDLALASMGMYVFNPESMWEHINGSGDDFGHNVIPKMVKDPNVKVIANVFNGYWEDVGQLESLIDVNLQSINNLDHMIDPYYVTTNPRSNLRPAKGKGNVNAIVSEGSVIDGYIENCVIGYQTIVEYEAIVTNSIIFGADRHLQRRNGQIIKENYCIIGERSIVNNVLLDRNVSIPRDVYLDGSLSPEIIHRGLQDIGLHENNEENPYGEYNITSNGFLVFGKLGRSMKTLGRDTLIPSGFDLRTYALRSI